jgi:hypothetical protein
MTRCNFNAGDRSVPVSMRYADHVLAEKSVFLTACGSLIVLKGIPECLIETSRPNSVASPVIGDQMGPFQQRQQIELEGNVR